VPYGHSFRGAEHNVCMNDLPGGHNATAERGNRELFQRPKPYTQWTSADTDKPARRDLPPVPYLTFRGEEPRQNFLTIFGVEKLEWWGRATRWSKRFRIWLAV